MVSIGKRRKNDSIHEDENITGLENLVEFGRGPFPSNAKADKGQSDMDGAEK